MSELSKVVSTPSESSWSQAYNAGKLYSVLSLEREISEEPQEDQIETVLDLNLIGKETLESLESEFFTLENKDLEGIKGAVERASEKLPPDIKASLVVAAESGNILYVVIKGKGRIDLKRNGQIGPVLESDNEAGIKTGSGFLEDSDTLILQTPQFTELVPKDSLASVIDSQAPSEIAETLAPKVHQSEKGGAASIIIRYKDETPPPTPAEEVVQEELQAEADAPQSKIPSLQILNKYFYDVKDIIKNKGLQVPALPHSKKMLLTVGVILVLVFSGIVILAMQKQTDKKNQEAFAQVYVEAQDKFEEGQSLLDLNQALARDSFQSAKTILEEGKSRFSKGSDEEKQVNELLTQVNQALSDSSGVSRVSPVEVDSDESEFLSFVISETDGIHFAKDDRNSYFVNNDNVSSQTRVLIENEDDWSDAGGLGTFLGNIYVLDRAADQILKFVATSGNEYGRANYFTGAKPDLANAQGLAIDGSIYVLLRDGTILKYTRGASENFQVTGLDKPLLNPTRIYTDSESNIYVLDNGNSRIVVIGKDGKYQSQYVASILRNAKELEVLEGDNQIFILSGSKIYRIDL